MLVLLPHFRRQAGVIGARAAPGRGNLAGHFLGRRARLRIDDPRPRRARDQVADLPGQSDARAQAVADIRPVEAGEDQALPVDPQLHQDIVTGMRIGGGGQRQPRHRSEMVEQRPQQAIVGPEVMTPFGHAMRLVDSKQRNIGLFQQFAEMRLGCAFRRGIEQVEFARFQSCNRLGPIVIGGGEGGRPDSDGLGAAQLVVHQRDQRRYHDRGAGFGEGRELIT